MASLKPTAGDIPSFALPRQVSIPLLAFAVLLFSWVWPLPLYAHRLFTVHMLQHILTMNLAALLLAFALGPNKRISFSLSLVATFQMAALWLWHTPAVFIASHHSPLLDLLMKTSLFAVAVPFWIAVMDHRGISLWERIFALLITGKVFCLLGAIFIFTRRPLYSIHEHSQEMLFTIEDQQLAGLVMVSACALIYVAAAIALFVQWIFGPRKLTLNSELASAGENPHA